MVEMHDNQLAAVQIGDGVVRGRIIRLGSALEDALGGRRYPEPVARLLGEAILIASLVARTLKFDGKLLVQTMGTNDGAVSMMVAECTTDGNVRAYARYSEEVLEALMREHPNPGADILINGGKGGGTFAMTIDQGAHAERYQGLAAIEGASLSDCAEFYFRQSEQVPTRLKLAVGLLQNAGEEPAWRGGGLLVQRVAGDVARSSTDDDWDVSKAVMGTVTDEELLDPDLSSDDLLYRLFHEQGVRRADPESITAKCGCSRERLLVTIKTFEPTAQTEMMIDGKITANCEFCGSEYIFTDIDL